MCMDPSLFWEILVVDLEAFGAPPPAHALIAIWAVAPGRSILVDQRKKMSWRLIWSFLKQKKILGKIFARLTLSQDQNHLPFYSSALTLHLFFEAGSLPLWSNAGRNVLGWSLLPNSWRSARAWWACGGCGGRRSRGRWTSCSRPGTPTSSRCTTSMRTALMSFSSWNCEFCQVGHIQAGREIPDHQRSHRLPNVWGFSKGELVVWMLREW